ncbi:glutamate-1-semialdehyde aminotransferase [Bradyrhizobium sp. I1.8.5]|uniref:hypothetical protein n=1 Tax=unclassified Bradyrhizobium TaxID=2631580 RepID=UPI0033988326
MSVFDASAGKPALPQGGTFSANPLSMVAGLASMTALDRAAFDHLERLGDRLREQLTAAIARHHAPLSVSGAASLFRIHPKAILPRDFREATPTAAQAHVMKELGRTFAESGIVLPSGAAACLTSKILFLFATPMIPPKTFRRRDPGCRLAGPQVLALKLAWTDGRRNSSTSL